MSYEKLTIVGNLGQDPELRHTDEGTPVTNLSVAVNKKRKGQKTTTWYSVSVWNGNAEAVCQYLKKGSKVLVEGGNLRARVYETKAGEHVASLDLTADRVVFLDSAEESNDDGADTVSDIPF